MTGRSRYCAIYDFELLPYALGDVLTWNIQTALRCEEAGRDVVDAYVCLDRRYPASIYQRNLVVAENSPLYFNELFGPSTPTRRSATSICSAQGTRCWMLCAKSRKMIRSIPKCCGL